MADRELIDNFDTDISKWEVVGAGLDVVRPAGISIESMPARQ
jgi:hypothetical protein